MRLYYDDNEVIKAFKMYTNLANKGYGYKDDFKLYLADDKIRDLVDQFAKEVDSVVFVAGDYIYLVPMVMESPFHITNESIKKDYLPSKAINMDIYLMYVTIIVLFGEFYDGYQSTNPTRDFISIDEWLRNVSDRIFSLKEYDKEELEELEKDYEYNWISILDKWDAMNDLKENVKNQNARTISRLGFLNTVKKFLLSQELINDIGNDEIELTQKAKTIIQRYYMEYEFNRGILDFMYNMDKREGEKNNAIYI
ncbi:DUF6063 family protein [Dethiothermospora halolimnae]|uniref:DUF6063 family protein n=1 Tax=Dethiothermospora halolimnae TaxID=3114390 RepID=UPI003CCC18A0